MSRQRKSAGELVKANGRKGTNISVRVPTDLIDALNRIADREDATRNQVVRRCLVAGLKEVYKTEVMLPGRQA